MALDFCVISLEKTNGTYIAEIDFKGGKDFYEIISNANIKYLDWISKLSILNGFDMPFDGELPYLKIKGLSHEAQKKEKGLEKAFLEFIKEE